MPAPIAPTLRHKIDQLSQHGETQAAIARKLGLHRATVARHTDGAAHEGSDNAGDAMTAAELAGLRALLMGAERCQCPRCGEVLVTLRTQNRGQCTRCLVEWVSVDVK